MERAPKNIMLTGSPGCGKTTLIRRLIEKLSDVRLAGFYTQELREHGQRVGFEAVGLSGSRAILAHVGFKTKHQVGKYGVEPERLEDLLRAELARPAAVWIVDEIGKMELLCPAFVMAVPELLDGPNPVVATVALKGGGLIAGVKSRKDVRLIHVTNENREGLPEELEGLLRGCLSGTAGR